MDERTWSPLDTTVILEKSEDVLDLTGHHSSYDLPALTNIADEITLEVWFKHAPVAPTATEEYIYDDYIYNSTYGPNGIIIRIKNGKLNFFSTRNSGGTKMRYSYPDTTVFDNQWHHAAITADASGNWKYYVDGVLVHTQTGPVGGSFYNTNTDKLGGAGGSNTRFVFDGAIKHLAVWNIPRTASQILKSYREHRVTPN
ncbi:MAG: LamG domain-containing protein, partial [Bacteroidia bacterium]|nr:LamG domain-containing protein [Bacteroidia bacterium]